MPIVVSVEHGDRLCHIEVEEGERRKSPHAVEDTIDQCRYAKHRTPTEDNFSEEDKTFWSIGAQRPGSKVDDGRIASARYFDKPMRLVTLRKGQECQCDPDENVSRS